MNQLEAIPTKEFLATNSSNLFNTLITSFLINEISSSGIFSIYPILFIIELTVEGAGYVN